MHTHVLADVNYLAVVVAAIATFILGGLWYAPFLFGNAWKRVNGFTDADLAKRSMPATFGAAFILQLISALVLAFFVGQEATAHYGALFGAHVGLAWVLTSFGVTYAFEGRPLSLLMINGGYHVVSFVVMGTILGAL